MSHHSERSGGRILIDSLSDHGVDLIFGVPGESYLAALDAIYERCNSIRYVTCRQEGGAAFMASAWSDATGRPGLCFVTRGPGVSNAMVALHTAYQGSTPLILLIGQIPRHLRDREAFQELDYRQMLPQVTKWVAEVESPDRLPEYVARAFKVACSGRPGPVALSLPEDMLMETASCPDIAPHPLAPAAPSEHDLQHIMEMLKASKQPLLLVGGTCWSDSGLDAVEKFSELCNLPVAVSFRRQGLISFSHPHFIGSVGYNGAPLPNSYAEKADLVIALNVRLNSMTSLKFKMFREDWAGQLVQCLPGPEDLGRLYQPALAVQADPNLVAMGLATLASSGQQIEAQSLKAQHFEITTQARAAYLSSLDIAPQPGPVDMAAVMKILNEKLPDQTTMSSGAGNATMWANQFYATRQRRGGLAPVSGAMGYGVAAAIAAKFARPEAPSVCLTGDGDFLMTGQELATAVQYGLNPIFIVIDNEMYGTIRAAQERTFPGRVSATALKNPDFAALAESYGAFGATVETTTDFAPALETALSCARPSVIHVKVGPKHLGPNSEI